METGLREVNLDLDLSYRKEQLREILDIIQGTGDFVVFDFSDLKKQHKEEIKKFLKDFDIMSSDICGSVWAVREDLPLLLNSKNSIAREIVAYRLRAHI